MPLPIFASRRSNQLVKLHFYLLTKRLSDNNTFFVQTEEQERLRYEGGCITESIA